MLTTLQQPWPWYIAGILLGLTVPVLLLLGNKTFGISSTLRHICAACLPAGMPFFSYDWKKYTWNLFFVAGICAGAFFAKYFLFDPATFVVADATKSDLSNLGIADFKELLPSELFSWKSLLSLRGFILIVVGGFLVGFGTRYADGCTSGHTIMGLSNLQWPSLVATICFMLGGLVMTHFLLPYILAL